VDRTTLEYMEERSKKARKIVEKIEQLIKNVESINNKRIIRVDFINQRYDSEFESKELTSLVSEAYIEIATEKIKELENELAAI
jgi:hypothetical protein